MESWKYAGKTGYGILLELVSNNVYLRSISRELNYMGEEAPKIESPFDGAKIAIDKLRKLTDEMAAINAKKQISQKDLMSYIDKIEVLSVNLEAALKKMQKK